MARRRTFRDILARWWPDMEDSNHGSQGRWHD